MGRHKIVYPEELKEKAKTLLLKECFSKTDTAKELGLSPAKLNSLIEEVIPGYESPVLLIRHRFEHNHSENIAAASAIAKKMFLAYPSLDFWRKVDLSQFQSIMQITHPYYAEFFAEKWVHFNLVIPKRDNKILGEEKIGDDYPVPPKKTIKSFFTEEE